MKISVSFLGIKENLKTNIQKLTDLNIDYLHLDIMDGQFVLNKTLAFEKLREVISLKKPLDIHLMVQDVIKYINDYEKLNPDFITIHYEVNQDIKPVIKYLKEKNIKVGLSIKPATDVNEIIDLLPVLDLVLVMSVEPGYGSQEFIMESIDKIDKLYDLRLKNKYQYLISVDGGINATTVQFVLKSDIIVIGSYITSGDYQKRLNEIKESIYG